MSKKPRIKRARVRKFTRSLFCKKTYVLPPKLKTGRYYMKIGGPWFRRIQKPIRRLNIYVTV